MLDLQAHMLSGLNFIRSPSAKLDKGKEATLLAWPSL